MRFLIISDDPNKQNAARTMFEELGHEVQLSPTVSSALEGKATKNEELLTLLLKKAGFAGKPSPEDPSYGDFLVAYAVAQRDAALFEYDAVLTFLPQDLIQARERMAVSPA